MKIARKIEKRIRETNQFLVLLQFNKSYNSIWFIIVILLGFDMEINIFSQFWSKNNKLTLSTFGMQIP